MIADQIEYHDMKKWIIFGGLLFLISNTGFGQVEGDVMDEKETAITNAVLIAKDSSGRSDTVQTDKRGFYCFRKLKPGNYTIEVKATGFQSMTQMIEVLPTPKDANEADDTYYAEVLDFILKRPKTGK